MEASGGIVLGPTVCLVEDHDLVRGHLESVMNDAGFRVVASTATSTEAEQAIRAWRPDLAVIDDHLPDGSGIDLCRRIRGVLPDMPLLLHTAVLKPQDELAALSAGISRIVLKNIDLSELIDAMHALTRGEPFR